jgi:hypothetical protein
MSRRIGITGAAALVTLLLATAGDALAQGCAMCGSAFAPDDPRTRAFNWSILFLMATPYAVVGIAGAWLFLACRRTPGRRAAVARLPRIRPTDPTEGGLA